MKKRYLFTLSDEANDALDFIADKLTPKGKKPNRSAQVEDAILERADQLHKAK